MRKERKVERDLGGFMEKSDHFSGKRRVTCLRRAGREEVRPGGLARYTICSGRSMRCKRTIRLLWHAYSIEYDYLLTYYSALKVPHIPIAKHPQSLLKLFHMGQL